MARTKKVLDEDQVTMPFFQKDQGDSTPSEDKKTEVVSDFVGLTEDETKEEEPKKKTTKKTSKRKCTVCGKYVDIDLTTKINDKYYCPDCKDAPLDEKNSYEALMKYIYEDLKFRKYDITMGRVARNVAKLKADYGMDNHSILLVLRYMYEFNDEPIPPPKMETEADIFLVLKYYRDADSFWKQWMKNAGMSFEDMYKALHTPPRTIVMNRSDLIKQSDRDALRRAKRENREKLSVDDIVDDGYIVDMNFSSKPQVNTQADELRLDILELTPEDLLEEGGDY